MKYPIGIQSFGNIREAALYMWTRQTWCIRWLTKGRAFPEMSAQVRQVSSHQRTGKLLPGQKGTADEDPRQIECGVNAKPYAGDTQTLYKIGYNSSSETGTVEEWKSLERK